MPCSARLRATTICVAMPAWSVPGSHSVLSPVMRCQRMVTSISVCSSMWPMCREPVTLGGGMTRAKTRRDGAAAAWKMPEEIHHSAQCGSNRWGAYTFSICMQEYFRITEGETRVERGNLYPLQIEGVAFGQPRGAQFLDQHS